MALSKPAISGDIDAAGFEELKWTIPPPLTNSGSIESRSRTIFRVSISVSLREELDSELLTGAAAVGFF